jgi:hypothetical protein
VTLGGKEGTIQANAMKIEDRGKRIVFSGGVVVKYDPPAKDTPLRDAAPATGAVPAAAAPVNTAEGAT